MDELRRIRNERGWSQQRLADRSGVDKVTIVHIETGKSSPNVATLKRLADALEVELGDFFPKAQSPLPLGLEISAASGGAGGSATAVTVDRKKLADALRRVERGEQTAEDAFMELAA